MNLSTNLLRMLTENKTSRRRPRRTPCVSLESLEQRELKSATLGGEAVDSAAATADIVEESAYTFQHYIVITDNVDRTSQRDTLPESISSVDVGDTYYVEIWFRDLLTEDSPLAAESGFSTGVFGSGVNVLFDPTRAEAVAVGSLGSPWATVFGSPALINNVDGVIHNLNQGGLPAAGDSVGVNEFARLGVIQFRAIAEGDQTIRVSRDPNLAAESGFALGESARSGSVPELTGALDPREVAPTADVTLRQGASAETPDMPADEVDPVDETPVVFETGIRFTDTAGNAIDSIDIGQEFRVVISGRDLRDFDETHLLGLLSAAYDVEFDGSLIDVLDTVHHYDIAPLEGALDDVSGLLDGVGGFFGVQSPGTGEAVDVVELIAIAHDVGTLNVTVHPDETPFAVLSAETRRATDVRESVLSATATLEINGRPDVVVTEFDALNDRVDHGTTVRFRVENRGQGRADGFDVQIIHSDDDIIGNADDQVVSTVRVDALDAGESTIVEAGVDLDTAIILERFLSENASTSAPGTDAVSQMVDYLAAIADSGNELDEADGSGEANNSGQGLRIDIDDVTALPFDLDNDGVIAPLDALRVITSLGQIAESDLAAVDTDSDGRVSFLDAATVIGQIGLTANDSVVESDAPASDGLVFHLTFDDGDLTDHSGQQHSAIVHGATLTTDRFGNENSAIQFDGVDDYIEVDNAGLPEGNESRTISLWARFDSTPESNPVLVSYGSNAAGQQAGVRVVSGGWQGSYWSSGFDLNTQVAPPVGEWVHVALAYDAASSTTTMYQNGDQIGSRSVSLNTVLSDNGLAIGRLTEAQSGRPYYFHGAIDGVRIHDVALSSSDVAELAADVTTSRAIDSVFTDGSVLAGLIV